MNRLTTRIGDKVFYSKGEYAPATLCVEMETSEVRECMKKLATYEDTGFEPEEVKQLNISDKGKEESSIKYYNEMRKYRDELKYYKKLEEQGRLIKLPCKVGDTVYLLGGKDYNKFRVGCVDWKSGMEYKGKNYQLYMEDNYYDKAYRNFSDIGKEIFLTREEAEKALKEMEGKQ